jgi:hypothetical protein
VVHSPSQTTRELNINIYFDVICIHTAQREREKSLSLLRLVDFTIVPAKKERKEKNWTGFFLRTPLRLFSETTDVKNTKKKRRERKKKRQQDTKGFPVLGCTSTAVIPGTARYAQETTAIRESRPSTIFSSLTSSSCGDSIDQLSVVEVEGG